VWCGWAGDETSVFIVVGAGGGTDYAAAFAKWAANWQQSCETAGARAQTIGLDDQAEKSLEQLRTALNAEPKDGDAELWLVLLGHGADDKFNLAGDDLSATELASFLKPFQRPLIVLNCFSGSGSFLAPLAAAGRIVITATKSGSERNYSRFGRYLSETIGDPAADFDKDGQTSVLEAWLAAAQHVAAFYTEEGRLATEHSLLDDNGDGKGTPADWFRGLRVVKKAKDGTPADGMRARQVHLVRNPEERALSAATRTERDALEMELARLREAKASMPEDAYYRDLETLLRKIAKLYEQQSTKAD
jgi:hypothetical protein